VKERKNTAASVKQRLLNLSRQRGEEFNLLLVRYGIERLLYRLGRSEHASEFVLKGAMLFHLWTAVPHRPTRDVDLLGRGTPDLARLEEVFRAVCALAVEEDGLDFASDSVVAERIKDDAEYEGVRVMLDARLGSARIRLQIDVGFGDATVPPPEPAEFPVLLDQPAPRLRAYRRETVIAEKLQAMVDLGLANSRMKDFFDLRFLAATFDFAGPELAGAIEATFARRNTAVPQEVPTGLTDGFAADIAKQTQWRAFLRRSGLDREDLELSTVVAGLRAFLLPPLEALAGGTPFEMDWPAGGPWRRRPSSGA